LSSANHPIRPVYYADPQGNYWTASELLPGKPTPLAPCKKGDFESWVASAISEPSPNLSARIAQSKAKRGWFFGGAQEAPGIWIPTSPQVRWVRDEMLCLGPVSREVTP
ncbi:MAG: hypothetical protein RLZZ142_2098, partial [Verrucomicrobiota bacterium]